MLSCSLCIASFSGLSADPKEAYSTPILVRLAATKTVKAPQDHHKSLWAKSFTASFFSGCPPLFLEVGSVSSLSDF